MDPSSTLPTIGASGAIAGVMGAYFVLYPQLARADARSRSSSVIEIIELPAIFLLGFWFLMQLFSAGADRRRLPARTAGGVAFMAHVAGFAMGAIAIFLFRKRPTPVEWI